MIYRINTRFSTQSGRSGVFFFISQKIVFILWNIVNYLDCKFEDVAKFVKHIFADWYYDSAAISLAKSAKKDPEKGNS